MFLHLSGGHIGPPPFLSLEYRRIPVDVIVYIIFGSLAYKLTHRKSRRLLYK